MTTDGWQDQLPRLLVEAGYYNIKWGRSAEADTLLKGAQEMLPDSPAPAIFRGILLISQSKYVDAEAWYRKMMERYPDDDNLSVYLAEVLVFQKRWSEAETLLHKIVSRAQEDSILELAKSMLEGLQTKVFQRATAALESQEGSRF